MTIPGKVHVGPDGKITGPIQISYNDPFPCVNGTPGMTGRMRGVLMHTIVGQVPAAVAVFNNPAMQASANFAIAQDGTCVQFGPLGDGWMAWHAVAANREWYGIEHADDGNPGNPLTAEQIETSAQLVECLSRFAGFPLQVTDQIDGTGYGTHRMGGAAFGGHSCPQREDGTGPRAGQRQVIIDLAKQIRHAGYLTCPVGDWTTIPGTDTQVMPALTSGTGAVLLKVRTVA